jgi:hypothetical protein
MCLVGMEETNSEEIAVSDAAGAAGARGDEDVDLSAMSADELRSLILRERWERAAARPSTTTTSIVTQSEPGCGKAGKHGKIATKKRHSAQ